MGSFVCLIPTQGMHGNERFVLVLLTFSSAFVIVNAVGAGIGLFPIGIVYGAEVWGRNVLGFMAGSILAALCISVELEAIPEAHVNVLAPFRLGTLLVAAVSPLGWGPCSVHCVSTKPEQHPDRCVSVRAFRAAATGRGRVRVLGDDESGDNSHQ